MDPLSALSFSCNVLDLVERAIKCGRTLKELYDSPLGQTAVSESLANFVAETRTIVADLNSTQSNVPWSRSERGQRDKSLMLVATRCQQLASELEAVVSKCNARSPHSLASTVKAGLRGYLKRHEIERLKDELESRGTTLHTLLATCTR
jgi:hypothetical protein